MKSQMGDQLIKVHKSLAIKVEILIRSGCCCWAAAKRKAPGRPSRSQTDGRSAINHGFRVHLLALPLRLAPLEFEFALEIWLRSAEAAVAPQVQKVPAHHWLQLLRRVRWRRRFRRNQSQRITSARVAAGQVISAANHCVTLPFFSLSLALNSRAVCASRANAGGKQGYLQALQTEMALHHR